MRQITIDGVTYPSMKAAARAIGVEYKYFYGIYADAPSPKSHRGPVTVRGVTYANLSEAAKALGVTTNAIHKAMSKQRLDYVGLGLRRPKANAAK